MCYYLHRKQTHWIQVMTNNSTMPKVQELPIQKSIFVAAVKRVIDRMLLCPDIMESAPKRRGVKPASRKTQIPV